MNKKFTLIELIVVIAILSLIATIVIPNTSGIKDNAIKSEVLALERNLQTATDMYSVNNFNALPSKIKPELGKPQPLDFNILYPKYIKNIPNKDYFYWIDSFGKIYVSTIDAPTGFSINGKNVSWAKVNGAIEYAVFVKEDTNVGAVSKPVEIKELITLTENKTELNEIINGELYLVKAIDKYGFETPLVGESYTGITKNGEIKELPIAKINVTPEGHKNASTEIFIESTSTTVAGHNINQLEWKLNGIPIETFPTTFAKGNYKIELRVKDDREIWSNWVSEEIFVDRINRVPLAVITYSPTTYVHNNTDLIFSFSKSTDPDGDAILNAEWKLDGVDKETMPLNLPYGTRIVSLRVQDELGLWSTWVTKNIEIKAQPVSVISYTTTDGLNQYSTITWDYSKSSSPDGSSITSARWSLDGIQSSLPSKLEVGTHTIGLQVQNSQGIWSEWSFKTIVISNKTPDFAIYYDKEYAIGTLVRQVYGSHPIPTLRSNVDLTDKYVTLVVAQYGTSLRDIGVPMSMPLTPNYVTISVKFTGSSYPIKFKYTDSWVWIKSVKVE